MVVPTGSLDILDVQNQGEKYDAELQSMPFHTQKSPPSIHPLILVAVLHLASQKKVVNISLPVTSGGILNTVELDHVKWYSRGQI